MALLTGKKRALLVGCNYPGTPYALRGCVSDVTAMSDLLRQKFGFTDTKQIRMLTEHSCTTANILDRMKWLVDGLVPGDVALFHFSGHGCFSGDTKIPLLNGEIKTLEELTQNYADKEFWVYSCDSEGNICAGKASHPRVTKFAEVINVILDNGEEIKCTEDHLFLMRDGTYKQAKDLVAQDSLMPLYRKISYVINHKVIRIETPRNNAIPVYDITVEKYHNFALDSGIFVHNSQVPTIDYDGSEPDGLDEVICPMDFDWRTKMIRDNDFKNIFGKIPDGVNLTVISDSCHSGSLLREIPGNPLESPVKSRYRVAPPDIQNRATDIESKFQKREIKSAIDKSILISGCRPEQTSADAWFQGRKAWHGACTYSILKALSDAGTNISYRKLVESVNKILTQQGYEQRPQLEGNETYFDSMFLAPFKKK